MTPGAAELYVSPEYATAAAELRVGIGAAVDAIRLPNPLYQHSTAVALNLAVPTDVARAALAVFMMQGGDLEISSARSVEAMQRAILTALAEYARSVQADAAAAARAADAAARAEALDVVRRRARIHLHTAQEATR